MREEDKGGRWVVKDEGEGGMWVEREVKGEL